MPKKYTGTAKLREKFDRNIAFASKKYVEGLQDFITSLPKLPPIDWSDPKVRSFRADQALKLDDQDEALKKAFTTANLDPADPLNWRKLLRIFAEVYFGRPGKRGPSLKWHSATWCQLLADYSAIEKKNPKANDTQICQKIINTFGIRYEKMDAATLRRNLGPAKDPNRNERLQHLSKTIASELERYCLDNDIELSEASIRKLSVERALEFICAEWPS